MSSKRIEAAIGLLLIAGSIGNLTKVPATEPESFEQKPSVTKAKSREFDFTYGTSIREIPVGAKVCVWIPVPQSNQYQSIKRVKETLPFKTVITTEPKYGNKMLYFETRATASGAVEFSVTYRVKRTEVLGLKSKTGTELAEAKRKLYLAANSKVPIDGKPVALLDGLELPEDDSLKLGELLYNKVEEHLKYDKSKPGFGTGDALWACDSRFGNCTDFHSLFISLTRSQRVPARFEIGFLLPEKRGDGSVRGYHCWAFFHVDGHGWVPVDISEADKHPNLKDYYFGNLTENRVAFTVGRDLTLVPKQDAEPLNYFIYPHVEIDGKVCSKDKLRTRFEIKDP